MADSKGIRLVKKVQNHSEDDKNLEILENILGDSRRYLQIILNFLSNSLKFTGERGKITVELRLVELQKVKSKAPNILKKYGKMKYKSGPNAESMEDKSFTDSEFSAE